MLFVIVTCIWLVSLVAAGFAPVGPIRKLSETYAKFGPLFIIGSLML